MRRLRAGIVEDGQRVAPELLDGVVAGRAL